MYIKSMRALLRATTASFIGLSVATAAIAQDDAEEDIGILILGQSKRDVQTDTATAVTNVDQEEIDDRQAGTVAELIDSVPGVNLVNGSTPSGSGINVRGFGANSVFGTDQKVKIIVDGADTGAEEIYRIGTQLFTDPSLYRSVEVIRGTVGSFEYGSGIVGGVVKLETKDASDFTDGELGFVGRQTLEFSSNGDGLTSSTILAWQPSDNLELLFNYTNRSQDGQTDGNGDAIGNSEFDLPSVLVKAKYTFGTNNDQSLSFSYTDSRTDEQDVQYDTFLTSDDVFGNVDRTIDSRATTLAYNFNPAGNDLIDLDVVLSYADQEIDQEYVAGSSSCEAIPLSCGFPFPVGGFGVVNADLRYETTKLSIKNTSNFVTGAVSHQLRSGFEYIYKERQDADSAPGGTDNRLAVFVIDELQIGDAWTITPALRYETSDLSGVLDDGTSVSTDTSALIGGISARYEFRNGFALFGSAAYTENLPILDDLESPVFRTQPEKATTYEVGASYNGTDVFRGGDTFGIKANVYHTELRDVTSFFGITNVETKGLEIEASYAMENGFYIDFNSNIVDGDETGNGIDRTFRGVAADTAQISIGKKFGEELDVSWEIVADRQFSRDDDATDNRPGFAVHNLRATYIPQQGVLEGTEIRVGVENVFDKQYTRRLSTRPAPGRNLKLTLSRTF
jgi:hemoglobin/transferrin/lactoferrin receptor protein